MKTLVMDEKVGETRLDRNPQGILGKPVDRYEGPLKVSGRATYAAEYLAGEDCAHGFVVMAKQGKGRLVKVDGSAAEAMPGVLAVIHGAAIVRNSAEPMSEAAKRNEGRVHHYGQPVALVVAESYEAARHAARSVKVEIEAEDGRYAIDGRLDEARTS
jgi:xanthine dehydrogenase YagR molybdenum-binding subunit